MCIKGKKKKSHNTFSRIDFYNWNTAIKKALSGLDMDMINYVLAHTKLQGIL